MKKSLLALAVLGAFAGAASAQSSVTLYGIVDLGYSYIDQSRDGASSISGIDAGLQSGNRLGFRGSEALGGGLNAIFNLEAGFNSDTGALGQGTTAVPTRIFGRAAWAGLQGGFGEVVLGRFGTFGSGTGAFEMVGEIDPFGTGFTGAGLQGTFSEVNSLRIDNSILYRTPVWGGFRAGVAYSFNFDGSEAAGSNNNNRVLSAGANWRGGPFYAALTYLQVDFATPAGAATLEDMKILQIGGTWDFKVAKLHAAWAKEENVRGTVIATPASGTSIPALNGADADAWMVGVTVPIGAGLIMASYQERDGDAVTGGFEADGSVWAIGYTHALSRRTNLYAVYGTADGDGSLSEGRLNPVAGGGTSFAASDAVNRARIMVGLRHLF